MSLITELYDFHEDLFTQSCLVFDLIHLEQNWVWLVKTKITLFEWDPDANIMQLETCPHCSSFVEEGDFGYYCEQCETWLDAKEVIVVLSG